MRWIVLSFLIVFSSCQPYGQIQDWFLFFKDQTLTELASEGSRGFFTPEERSEFLVLFLDIEEAGDCDQMVNLLENNLFLKDYAEKNNFNTGFLFDVLNGYTYEGIVFSGLDLNEIDQQLAWAISNTWKTKFSSTRINSVLAALTYCYPY